MPPIIGVQFQPTGKQYHFDAQGLTDLKPGDRVVVETARGRQLGTVAGYVPEQGLERRVFKPIERSATPCDLVMQRKWQAKALGALVMCGERAEKLGLKGYKFARAEYNFDGSQVTILYTTEKKRADLTALQRELRRALRTRVELYQIGPRDLAKLLDGLGACGVRRCCSRFLTQFSSVSIRMAKLQNISLAPSEITGVCGRLRCCLTYEHEQYAEAAKGLPKRGKQVVTPYGSGRVIEVRALAGEVVVALEAGRKVVQREDIGREEFRDAPADSDGWPAEKPASGSSAAEAAPLPGRPAPPRKQPPRSLDRKQRGSRKRGGARSPSSPTESPTTPGRLPSRRGRQDKGG